MSLECTDSSTYPDAHRPFSGVTGATAGTLSFLVGGPEETHQLALPILSYMGARIIHCGLSGSGLAAKICNNVKSVNLSFGKREPDISFHS